MAISKPITLGSIKNKVVDSDLLEERALCNFDQKAHRQILF